MKQKIILSLILPVHNEEDIIEKVFTEIYICLREADIAFEIILVENGSMDTSYKKITYIAKKFPHTKAIISPKGYGNAIIAGQKIAQGKYIGHMPSDGQIYTLVLPELVHLLESGKYHLVKTKRVTREHLGRYIPSVIFDAMISVLFRMKFYDINGSPKIFLRKYLSRLNLEYRDSFIDTELMIKAKHLDWVLHEIPMKNRDRYGGKSTRTMHTYIEFLVNIFYYKTGNRLREWKQKYLE